MLRVCHLLAEIPALQEMAGAPEVDMWDIQAGSGIQGSWGSLGRQGKLRAPDEGGGRMAQVQANSQVERSVGGLVPELRREHELGDGHVVHVAHSSGNLGRPVLMLDKSAVHARGVAAAGNPHGMVAGHGLEAVDEAVDTRAVAVVVGIDVDNVLEAVPGAAEASVLADAEVDTEYVRIVAERVVRGLKGDRLREAHEVRVEACGVVHVDADVVGALASRDMVGVPAHLAGTFQSLQSLRRASVWNLDVHVLLFSAF